jgi:hypothetical protein
MERIDMRLRQHLPRENGRIDFQKAAAVKDRSQLLTRGLSVEKDLSGLQHFRTVSADGEQTLERPADARMRR